MCDHYAAMKQWMFSSKLQLNSTIAIFSPWIIYNNVLTTTITSCDTTQCIMHMNIHTQVLLHLVMLLEVLQWEKGVLSPHFCVVTDLLLLFVSLKFIPCKYAGTVIIIIIVFMHGDV